jgi:hypothetical protein
MGYLEGISFGAAYGLSSSWIGDHHCPLCYETFVKPIDGWMNKNVRLEDSFPTLHVSTTKSGTSFLVLEDTLSGHRCRILVDSGALKNFCKAEWVREHHILTVSGEKYRINKLVDNSTTTTRQRLLNAVLTVRTMDIRYLDAIMTDMDKFDIILGQPWSQAVDRDIDWSTKTICDRKTREAMVSDDENTVPLAVHHLEADAMAELLRQKPADLFVIGLRGVQVAVDDITTDQQPEWMTPLRDSMNEFTDIIKEPGGLPPTRECAFEINVECDEPPKERTYRMSPAELREVHV